MSEIGMDKDSGRDFYLDCFSGLAGDMFLGACLDLGMPVAVLEKTVEALGLEGVSLEVRRSARGGLAGTRFRVLLDGRPVEGPDPEERQHGHDPTPHPPTSAEEPTGGRRLEVRGPAAERRSDHDHDHPHTPGTPSGTPPGTTDRPHPDADPETAGPPAAGGVAGDHPHQHGHSRNLAEIRQLIEGSSLAPAVKETALDLFARLGEAEARAHGIPVERVHFHEVGALDSIVDLVGAAAAYHHLAPRRLTCGRINVGGGTVQTAHGRLPVPAPATAWLVRGLPVHGGAGGELLTPTGAVILAELVDDFGDLPAMELEAVGYGLGKKHLQDQPNAVRLVRGRSLAEGEGTAAGQRVVVLEAQVDDLPGEGFGFLMERLLEEGALDVFFTPVQMKKNRPGTLVTVLARPALREPLAALLLAESGSLGCRYQEVERIEAEREVETVATRWGAVRVKVARLGPRRLGAAPEYEDCRRLAREHDVPWREVYRSVLAGIENYS